jgi:hypothetical protein
MEVYVLWYIYYEILSHAMQYYTSLFRFIDGCTPETSNQHHFIVAERLEGQRWIYPKGEQPLRMSRGMVHNSSMAVLLRMTHYHIKLSRRRGPVLGLHQWCIVHPAPSILHKPSMYNIQVPLTATTLPQAVLSLGSHGFVW